MVWYVYCTVTPYFYDTCTNETNCLLYDLSNSLGIFLLSLICYQNTEGIIKFVFFIVTTDWLYENIEMLITRNEYDLVGNTIQNILVIIPAILYYLKNVRKTKT